MGYLKLYANAETESDIKYPGQEAKNTISKKQHQHIRKNLILAFAIDIHENTVQNNKDKSAPPARRRTSSFLHGQDELLFRLHQSAEYISKRRAKKIKKYIAAKILWPDPALVEMLIISSTNV
jgi:hypothetical protein